MDNRLAGAGNDCASVRSSHVSGQMERLRQEGGSLQEWVSQLEHRLSSVVRSEPSSPSAPIGKEPASGLVDHANTLRQMAEDIATVNRRIESLLGRIEL